MDARRADIARKPRMRVDEQARAVILDPALEPDGQVTERADFEAFFPQLDEADTGVQRFRENVLQRTGRTRLAVCDQIERRQPYRMGCLIHG
jgi:hypothetical protein